MNVTRISLMADLATSEARNQRLIDAITWAICPHIRRWSDPYFSQYASQECQQCQESVDTEMGPIVAPCRVVSRRRMPFRTHWQH